MTVKELESVTEEIKKAIFVVSEIAEESVSSTQSVSAATEEQLASMQEISASSITLEKMAEESQLLTMKFKI